MGERVRLPGTRVSRVDQFFEAAGTLARLWDLSEHPFCRRWAAGEARDDELAAHAAQNRHAVAALVTLMRRAAAPSGHELTRELEARARVEFACAQAWRPGDVAPPAPETARCAATWVGADDAPLARQLAVVLAIVSARARLHADALAAGGPAEAFAAGHERLVKLIRRELEPLLRDAPVAHLLHEVGAALLAQWEQLAAVERTVHRRRPRR